MKPGDLWAEIQQTLDDPKVPSYIAESLDAVRAIGNFATHPIKSKNSGEVVPVEPGETEWVLTTLEALFEFFYVQPAKLALQREALNEKLTDAGKRPLR